MLEGQGWGQGAMMDGAEGAAGLGSQEGYCRVCLWVGQGGDHGMNIMTKSLNIDFVHDALICLLDQYQES